jgi:SAM-dependent methyltransferase
MSWRARSDVPNSRTALAARQAALDAAAAAPISNRIRRITELCGGRRVLDIGCVDHHVGTHEQATFLHRRLVESAASVVGVDIEPAGVAAMREAGFEVVVHDVCTGAGPLAAYGPFDVVVAGEVVEHLAAPQALFEFAAAVLAPGGALVLTTPNPYAPHRVRAGRLGIAWENVDHVVYAFPSGVVELGERTGLHLDEHRTVLVRPMRKELWRALKTWASLVADRLRGRSRAAIRDEELEHALNRYANPLELAFAMLGRSSRFLGETSLYVLRKPVDSP